MKFLVDANLPIGLAVWLRQQGHEATHVSDSLGCDSDDRTILEFAQAANLIVVTKDEDFATRLLLRDDSPQVVWLRLGNATNAVLKAWLKTRWVMVIQELSRSERLVEVI